MAAPILAGDDAKGGTEDRKETGLVMVDEEKSIIVAERVEEEGSLAFSRMRGERDKSFLSIKMIKMYKKRSMKAWVKG